MTLAEICGLRIAEVADPAAFLFLWCPGAGLPMGLEVMQRWGFQYTGQIVWDKLPRAFGTGYYCRYIHENLLFARMEKAPRHFHDHTILSILRARKGAHSQKPDEVYPLIEGAVGGGDFLELFARRRNGRPGWSQFGRQLAPADGGDHLLAAD
jgi:N6-adenosine-specific RNA methylase IME4